MNTGMFPSLKELQRRIITLRNEGKTFEEIAERTGISRYTVSRRLKRGVPLKSVKKVSQFTLDGKYLTTYRDCAEASRKTGISKGNIWSSAAYRRSQAGGYLWVFTEIPQNLDEPSHCQHCGKVVPSNEKVIISFDCLQDIKEKKYGNV